MQTIILNTFLKCLCPWERDMESVEKGTLTVYTEHTADSSVTQQSTSDAGGHHGDGLMISKKDSRLLEQSLQEEVSALLPMCSCPCSTKFDVTHQPANLEKSKRSICTANRSHNHGLLKPPGIKSTHGSVCALPSKKFYATCAAMQKAIGWLTFPSTAIWRLWKMASHAGRKQSSASCSTNK